MTTLIQDLKYGIRMLLKSPGFTLAAVLALGLGIGANTTIFSVINTMLMRPVPAPDPDRLVVPLSINRQEIGDDFSYPDYLDMRSGVDAFEGVLAHRLIHVALSGASDNEILWGELVSGNYFDVLHVAPAPGRGFLPEEDATPISHPVAVISHSLWQRRFASDPTLVGRTITLNATPFTVLGVAPEGFTGTKFALSMDLWIPVMMHPLVAREGNLNSRGGRWLELMARLKPGVTLEQADAEIKIFAKRLEDEYPRTHGGRSAAVVPETKGRFPGHAAQGVSVAAALAMGVVGLVLLIACANVANLLLARAAGRGREIGVRLALGATRGRLVRQHLTESLLLSLLGGAFGLLIAMWSADSLKAFVPPIPYTLAIDYSPDGKVLAFTLAASLLTAGIFGLLPALRASRLDPAPILKGAPAAGVSNRRLTLRDALVVTQVTASVIVLACAGLFLKSLDAAQRIDPGFQPDGVLLATFDLALLGYTEEQGRDFQRRAIERIEAIPGVRRAALARFLPLGDSSSTTGPIVAEGKEWPEDGSGLAAMVNWSTPGFLEAIGMSLVRGRDFSERDAPGAPDAVVVNERLASLLWPGEDPVGRRFRIGSSEATPAEVVGVVRDGKYRTLGESPTPYFFIAATQEYRPEMTLLVRAEGETASLVEKIRREIRSIDSRLPVFDVKTLTVHMGYALWWTRMGATLASAFGLVALTLASVGLYGLLAYSVSRRTKEIGVRMALGAGRGDVFSLVVGGGMRLTLAGLALGLALSFAIGRVMSGILYGAAASDPVVFAGSSAVLLLVAFVACWLPARRASRVNPMTALRTE